MSTELRYRLMDGRHTHYKREDVEAAREKSQERRKAGMEAVSPLETNYIPGDEIVPQSDAEALLMKQDSKKFAPLTGVQQDQISELIAENARLKQLLLEKEKSE